MYVFVLLCFLVDASIAVLLSALVLLCGSRLGPSHSVRANHRVCRSISRSLNMCRRISIRLSIRISMRIIVSRVLSINLRLINSITLIFGRCIRTICILSIRLRITL